MELFTGAPIISAVQNLAASLPGLTLPFVALVAILVTAYEIISIDDHSTDDTQGNNKAFTEGSAGVTMFKNTTRNTFGELSL